MYRGLSDYLGHANIFHSTQVTPGAVPSNSTPFGNFVVPPGAGDTSAFGNMQSGSQPSDEAIASLTVASCSDVGEEKASGVGDGNV